jgi:glycerol uptake facilitator-like aquaporin
MLPTSFIDEFWDAFLLAFFGCGSVCAAATIGAQVGVFQVAIVWGSLFQTRHLSVWAFEPPFQLLNVTFSLFGSEFFHFLWWRES